MALLGVFAIPSALIAAKKDKGRAPSVDVDVAVVFGESDQRIIRDWVHGQPASGLPPGLAKRDRLPPGLEKQLHRKGHLPPGLEKRLSPFPLELEGRLQPLGPDHERVFIHGRAAIVTKIGRIVVDIFVP